MRTVEIETQDERICQTTLDLVELAEELAVSLWRRKTLLLACVITLLFNKELLTADVIKSLGDTQERLNRELFDVRENGEGAKGPKYLKLVKAGA